MITLPPLTLITGGARSGKSAYAERLARASGLQRRYLATGQAFDSEMATRIEQHRRDRGEGWQLLETPLDVAPALASAAPDSVTLFDCATLWLSNQLFAGRDLAHEAGALIGALAASPGPVILVTNELGQGIVPGDALSRQFRDEQGRLNQRLGQAAGLVIAVMCGLPLALKGPLPELPELPGLAESGR